MADGLFSGGCSINQPARVMELLDFGLLISPTELLKSHE